MNTKRVLVIEDDADAADVLEAYLRREKYEVIVAGDGIKGLNMVKTWHPDIVLLDMMLPEMHGKEVLLAIRRSKDVPVIMVTAMCDTHDIVGALGQGADDYVVKPYDPGEVVARVQAVLRRKNTEGSQSALLHWEGMVVDPELMTVTVTDESGQVIKPDLTPTELTLLMTLMDSPTRPLSRQYLLERCLPDSDALERVVDTHIYNLRKKLELAGVKNILLNVRGIGYRFRQP